MNSLDPENFPSPLVGARRRAARGVMRVRPSGGTWRGRLALILALSTAGMGGARADVPREYDVKAVLLYNFTHFVDWPVPARPQEDEPLVIGVLGRDPFGKALDEAVRAERAEDRRITVVRYQRIEAVQHCHILFVSDSEHHDLPHILSVLGKRPILTVADFENFVLQGGMVRFRKSPEGKIQLRVNLEAVRAAGLTMSAKLLRVADVISVPAS